ncbi:ATP synthase F1 subunit epsilon [Candidatus Woesebacteria bacterium RIFCSPHIGHO2_01_FULL_44_21]|uniref:ATP synthase epsilon chain n=1 Tax=Candidatus Woesebacteria bacterium RIFCSPHIGHO2_01_FULL_44_21 TaxID=1802503 RepID=A0A1F7YZU8_9BACT|nr:MAG: ATP synthase F1 subunit epsilon [Candidatus Woesebacteria bacterium RIFCSPHIGHO2_01_FULL_44_21]OGM71104.1 MAG: ATP synthase F1 subunit epsilon [Candidatus Woesebacteria bacterium RIFCSPLOWO2_01_FULL_44_24b]
MNFQLDIVDSKRNIYSGEALKLTIPAIDGEMTVEAQHMPVVTPVSLGMVVAQTPEKELALTIGKGIFSFEGNHATLLIEDTSFSEEISEEKANEAQKRAEEIIQKGIEGPDLEAALATIRRSTLDLKVVRRRKHVVV